MELKTAWIAGATGLTGGHCLRALLESAEYGTIAALTRRPLGLHHAKLIEVAADGSNAPPPDDVFCAVGTTIRKAGSQAAFRKVDQELVLAIAARAKNASQFLLVSSVGAHAPRGNFYLQVKRETEDQLNALPFRAVHIFRPSFLMGDRSESRPLESAGSVVARGLGWMLAGGLRRYRPIEAEAVARAMPAAAAQNRSGRFIYHYDEIMSLLPSRK